MKNITYILTAFAVSIFFTASYAQTKTKPKNLIKPPVTSAELVTPEKKPEPAEEREVTDHSTPSNRKLRQHGFGVGLGQTFLLGKFADYGDNKITMDLFYTYSASYSFDLIANAHYSSHSDKSERVSLMGANAGIKSRLFEFDNFSPFLMGGLGFYAPKVRRVIDGDPKWSDRNTTFGLNFGGGLDLRLNDEYVIGVLGQLHWPFNKKQSDQPEVKGYYFKLLMTLTYLF